MKLSCLIVIATRILTIQCGVWNWLITGKFNADDDNKPVDHSMGSSLGHLATVPFEMRTGDEKFILEAAKYGLQASDLDICHHKVIMQLRKACGSLTEEDIGKLSVHLLNCQSSVENRRTYRCTEDMTISQCTKDMDPNTWNAYHIVSNRARAVCYASRQQQFTAKAEMTVNKLVYTSETQLVAMQKLEDGQSKVSKMTQKTLDTMVVGQKELTERQEILKSSQHQIQSFVHGNLRELTREKALIAAGQKELAGMTESIQRKLDEASQHLISNEDIRKSNHKEILQDLSKVQAKAREMWEKIDNSTQFILKQHSEAVLHYQSAMENLKKINSTVTYLLALVDKTRKDVDAKLGWVTNLLYDAGERLTVIYSMASHGTYFLASAIIASFINAPVFSRWCIIILIPLNALSHMQQKACLDFASLTLFLVSTLAMQWMIESCKKALNAPNQLFCLCSKVHTSIRAQFNSITLKNVNRTQVQRLPRNTGHDTIVENHNLDASTISNITAIPNNSSTPKNSPERYTTVDARNDLTNELDTVLNRRKSRAGSTSSTSSNPKKLCAGSSKSGLRCKIAAAAGRDYCFHHTLNEEN